MNTLAQQTYDFKVKAYEGLIELILSKADETSKLGRWSIEVDVSSYNISSEDIRVIARELKNRISDSVFVTWHPLTEKKDKTLLFGLSKSVWVSNYSKIGSIVLEWKI